MNRTDEFSEIRDIADSICNEDVTDEQVAHLETLLDGNEAAQRFYYDYISMHVHMKSAAEPNMEIVRRRLQVEEVIVRPIGSQTKSHIPLQNSAAATSANFSRKEKSKYPLIIILCATFLLMLGGVWKLLLGSDSADVAGEILNGRLTISGDGFIQSSGIGAGNYIVDTQAIILFDGNTKVKLEPDTHIKIYNGSELELKQGSLQIFESSGHNIKIHAPSFTLYSEGANLTLDFTQTTAQITAEQAISLLPSRWRPKHYWSFDSESDRAADLAGAAHGIPSRGAKKVQGLLGNGAFYFDNSADARINVGSGGGTAPATGSFAVIDGVSIEALIKPDYSGLPGELDEIFRKDQSDREYRMLLSFQHDKGKKSLRPEGDVDESLSFGLYLVGQGYHELKLPLDGKQGRPSLEDLKDGKAHHVVALYDVITGVKAIYIDGVMHARYQYPPGSKMLSGGSGFANIGNSPNDLHDPASEAYSGVIDEVAFYDFALTDYMIKRHYNMFESGRNYYGLLPKPVNLPGQLKILIEGNQTISIDPVTGLPSYTAN